MRNIINLYIQEVQQTPKKINIEINTKTQYTQNTERQRRREILKAAREK